MHLMCIVHPCRHLPPQSTGPCGQVVYRTLSPLFLLCLEHQILVLLIISFGYCRSVIYLVV